MVVMVQLVPQGNCTWLHSILCFPPSLIQQPQEHWGWRTRPRDKETTGDLGKCYLIREAKCQLGRCCGSWRRQRIFAGGGLSANSISSSVHGQTNAMEGYPPIWPTGDGEVISGQSCCDRGKEHIFQCQFKWSSQQVAGRFRKVTNFSFFFLVRLFVKARY